MAHYVSRGREFNGMNKRIFTSIKKLSLIIFTSALIACSSSPQHVSPSRPLVENIQYSNQVDVPEEIWLDLDTRNESFSFTYKEKLISVGNTYLSALGNICRPITASSDKNVDKRVVCRKEFGDGWYLTPDIILMENDEFPF